jgi:hypothetical protein
VHDLVVMRTRGPARFSVLTGMLALSAMLALSGAISGCASPAIGQDPGPLPAAAPATSQSSPSAGPAPATHPVNESVQSSNGFVTLTVFDYQQPVGAGAAPPTESGDSWGALDVRACASTSSLFDVGVSVAPWRLLYTDGTSATPTTATQPQFPQPTYPTSQMSLTAGECTRGWVVFPVHGNAQPTLARWSTTGATPITWRIP